VIVVLNAALALEQPPHHRRYCSKMERGVRGRIAAVATFSINRPKQKNGTRERNFSFFKTARRKLNALHGTHRKQHAR
jgi:hypothetical protein